MKTFYVLWTYSANFSRLIEVQAETAEQARRKTTGYFSTDFQEKGNVYVFDTPPVLIQKGKYYDE